MTDIVERLRDYAMLDGERLESLWHEIDRLRARLAEMEKAMDGVKPFVDGVLARLAEAVDLFAEPEIIEETFGPRCSEYEPGCPCCRAWKWLDDNRAADSASGCDHPSSILQSDGRWKCEWCSETHTDQPNERAK